MPYVLDPLVAGELGEGTELDTSMHPPNVQRLEYVIDEPYEDDLIQSFPVYLVSERLARRLIDEALNGFVIDDATVLRSDAYGERFGGEDGSPKDYKWLRLVPHDAPDCQLNSELMLLVSDRMMAILREGSLRDCIVEEVP